MSMTYREIQDAVIRKCCDSSQRADVQAAIKLRHSMLWNADRWTFRYGTTDVTFTAGSNIATPDADDVHAVIALFDANGSRVQGVADFLQFFSTANANANLATGSPSRYTVLNGSIYTDVLGDGTVGTAIYRKSKPTLANDNDTTGLPDDYDLALVHGGKAEMFKLQIVPDLATSFDGNYNAVINSLQRNYLAQVKEPGQQWGAYTPGF